MKKLLQLFLILVLAFPVTANAASNSEKTNKGLPDRIDQLEQQIKTIEESLKNQAEYIDSLEAEVADQKLIIKKQDEELSRLKENQVNNNEQIHTMNENLSHLNEIVSTVQGTVQHILRLLERMQDDGERYSISGKATFANDLPILSYGIFYSGDNGVNGESWSLEDGGLFKLENLPEGTYTLKFGSKENPLLEQIVHVDGNKTNLNLVSELEGVQVKGKMVDSTGKQFVFSHHMQDVDKGIRYSSDTTYHDDEGNFVYILPKNSTYKLGLDHEGYHIKYPSTISVNDEEVNEVVFTLDQPTYSISAQVLDLQGNPISRKGVSIKYSTEHGGGIYGAGWRTNENGEFFLDGLIAGTYTIQIGDDPENPMISHEVVLTDSNINGLLIK